MPYVQRDGDGAVTGIYANSQPGYAEEWLDDDHADVVAYLNPPPPQATQVSPAQARIALFNAGLLDEVEAVVEAHPYKPVQIYFNAATVWDMNHPYVQGLGTDLGLTETQIRELFNAAALI